MRVLVNLFCIVQLWGYSYDFVVSDVYSNYSHIDDECILYIDLSEKIDSQIEVVEPEPPEHVVEAMTLFKWECRVTHSVE